MTAGFVVMTGLVFTTGLAATTVLELTTGFAYTTGLVFSTILVLTASFTGTAGLWIETGFEFDTGFTFDFCTGFAIAGAIFALTIGLATTTGLELNFFATGAGFVAGITLGVVVDLTVVAGLVLFTDVLFAGEPMVTLDMAAT